MSSLWRKGTGFPQTNEKALKKQQSYATDLIDQTGSRWKARRWFLLKSFDSIGVNELFFFFTGRPMFYLFRFQSECHQYVKLSFLSYFPALPPPSHLFAFTTSILLPSDSTSRLHFSSLLPPTIKTRCIARLLLVPLHRSASLFHEMSKQLRKMLVVNLQGSLL